MNPNLEEELELCPFLKKCQPDDEQVENYCCLNYEECEVYIKYQRDNYEAD